MKFDELFSILKNTENGQLYQLIFQFPSPAGHLKEFLNNY